MLKYIFPSMSTKDALLKLSAEQRRSLALTNTLGTVMDEWARVSAALTGGTLALEHMQRFSGVMVVVGETADRLRKDSAA